MSLIQKFKDLKEWVGFEVEYTQTKVEKPNKTKVGWYILICGFIIAVIGILILIISPSKEVAYEGIRNERLPPFGTISSGMIIGGMIIIVASIFVFLGTDRFSNKKEV